MSGYVFKTPADFFEMKVLLILIKSRLFNFFFFKIFGNLVDVLLEMLIMCTDLQNKNSSLNSFTSLVQNYKGTSRVKN